MVGKSDRPHIDSIESRAQVPGDVAPRSSTFLTNTESSFVALRLK